MTDPTDDNEPLSDAEELEENNVTHTALKFHPQRWETHAGDEYAVQAGDPISFLVPVEDTLNENGNLIEERTKEMDQFKHHGNAPSVVKCWSGPFEIYYDEFYSNPETNENAVRETALAVVTFHPQIPVDGELVEPDDTWTFTVPAELALTDDGTVVEDDTEASDQIAAYNHAPEIVQQWTYLTDWYYYITVDAFRISGTDITPPEFVETYLEDNNGR